MDPRRSNLSAAQASQYGGVVGATSQGAFPRSTATGDPFDRGVPQFAGAAPAPPPKQPAPGAARAAGPPGAHGIDMRGESPSLSSDSMSSLDQRHGTSEFWPASATLGQHSSQSTHPLSPGDTSTPVDMHDSEQPMRDDFHAALLWEKSNVEPDDYLHDPDPELNYQLDRQWANFSHRGWLNGGVMAIVFICLVGVFAGWPISQYAVNGGFPSAGQELGYNVGGINSSGQVPDMPSIPSLIDSDTPEDARTRTGFDGEKYNLVFSDEFNVDGRTFWPGDDPFWEAVNLNYWQTSNLEWLDPDAATTRNGKLEITMTEEPIHNFNYRSAMLQSWNKMCFQGGYLEVKFSLPGTSHIQGFWPGIWTQGNLARTAYGATNDGVWPYSYSSCDAGTLPNQTFPDGTPRAAKTTGSKDYGGELSWLPGQRLSACTCEGEDHPGPHPSVGRGSPEIDAIEAQVDSSGLGSASQTFQTAPFNAGYNWDNSSTGMHIYNTSRSHQNLYTGDITQQSCSVVTLMDDTSYGGEQYETVGFELNPGPDGSITWAYNGEPTWQLKAAGMGPDPQTNVGQRLMPTEPLAINLNLFISTKFQMPEYTKLQPLFPATFYIDYVRLYQKGKPKVSCDPDDMPTAKYINDHLDAYTNANLTTWALANYTQPKNRLVDQC